MHPGEEYGTRWPRIVDRHAGYGHVTESIYVRYAIVDESVQREALEKLAKSVNVPSAMPQGMP